MDCKHLYLVLGLWMVVTSCCSRAVLASPSTTEQDDESAPSDYAYSDVEEGPAEQVKPPANSSHTTMMPYFKQKTRKIQSKLDAPLKLDCPVKNLDEKTHQILWFKDSQLITNGPNALNNLYQVDDKFNLLVETTNATFAGTYNCSIVPTNVSQLTVVELVENSGQMMNTVNVAIMSLILLIQKHLASTWWNQN